MPTPAWQSHPFIGLIIDFSNVSTLYLPTLEIITGTTQSNGKLAYRRSDLKEETCNIWDYLGKAVIAITTNGSVARDRRAVLGRGCARQAAAYFPDLALRLGALIGVHGNHVQIIADGLVSFPVEETAWSLPDLVLVSRSARELRDLADREQWRLVVIPRPGCGGGGLQWQDVAPLLTSQLDDRFLLVSLQQ